MKARGGAQHYPPNAPGPSSVAPLEFLRPRTIGAAKDILGADFLEPCFGSQRVSGLLMFRVKICGVTGVDDALLAVESGADAIGLNFYEKSPRFCADDRARQICQAIPRDFCKVGVFVNSSAEAIRETARELGLHAAQLHGDEPPEFVAQLRGLPVIKAFRLAGDFGAVGAYLDRCHGLRAMPRMVLVDAHKTGQFGGTGATLDWHALASNRPAFRGLPLVLAGGLTAANVAEAIGAAHPWAVDTASGVEAKPGLKSPDLVRAFVATASEALRHDAAHRVAYQSRTKPA